MNLGEIADPLSKCNIHYIFYYYISVLSGFAVPLMLMWVGFWLEEFNYSIRDGSKHMLARRSLGARALVLESEHMLGSLVLGLDAQRVLGEHQRITE